MDVAVVLVDGDREVEVHFGTPLHAASMEWARFHGLDPMKIPAGSVVERDAANRRILFEEFVKTGPRDGDVLVVDGEVVAVERIEQGEAPPLPFPEVG